MDFIGKIDNTEFAIALPETSIEEARHVAERQLALVKNINTNHSDTAETAETSIRIVISHIDPGENAEHIYTRSKHYLPDILKQTTSLTAIRNNNKLSHGCQKIIAHH